jgi:hypothetical protein
VARLLRDGDGEGGEIDGDLARLRADRPAATSAAAATASVESDGRDEEKCTDKDSDSTHDQPSIAEFPGRIEGTAAEGTPQGRCAR